VLDTEVAAAFLVNQTGDLDSQAATAAPQARPSDNVVEMLLRRSELPARRSP